MGGLAAYRQAGGPVGLCACAGGADEGGQKRPPVADEATAGAGNIVVRLCGPREVADGGGAAKRRLRTRTLRQTEE